MRSYNRARPCLAYSDVSVVKRDHDADAFSVKCQPRCQRGQGTGQRLSMQSFKAGPTSYLLSKYDWGTPQGAVLSPTNISPFSVSIEMELDCDRSSCRGSTVLICSLYTGSECVDVRAGLWISPLSPSLKTVHPQNVRNVTEDSAT